MAKTIKEHLEHPMSAFLLIATIAAGIAGWNTITGDWKASHTTQVELDLLDKRHQAVDAALELQIKASDLRAKCTGLKIQISLAESAIWQMEQAGDQGQRLVEKRRELRGLTSQYNNARCASVLSV